jgi:RimJ/RimL family protein N-acetyltransferase
LVQLGDPYPGHWARGRNSPSHRDVRGTRVEVAWIVGLPWQGQGYAEAARAVVHWLTEGGIGYITAHVHPEHAASAAVARKAGLRATDAIYDGERRWALDRPATST